MQSWNSPPVPRLPVVASGTGLRSDGSVPAPSPVRLFDSARRALVAAGPADGTARLYVCGITPYDATHMGHANTYVSFDLLNRVWRDAGLEVHYVQNVTDVDDPLLERATATGVDWTDLAQEQIQLFREDMEALRVLPPAEYVGAVESVPLIVDLISELRERGAVYAVDDADFPDLYFAQSSDPEFGSLSHLSESDAVPVFAER
ncbi:MAG TPA: cysteine--1-D-myo-inosityl 2-amino-2-deoxy-alpha-D-glucopyranoside ligase, partial [Propionibacteriaceae bacterium]